MGNQRQLQHQIMGFGFPFQADDETLHRLEQRRLAEFGFGLSQTQPDRDCISLEIGAIGQHRQQAQGHYHYHQPLHDTPHNIESLSLLPEYG
ncbi:hypothetical protein D3C78_1783640 [compost metagenome]